MQRFYSCRFGVAFIFSLLIAGAADLSAQQKATDWPQFRGPAGTGASPNTGLPTTWSQTQNVVWKTPLAGPGTSSPVVIDDKILLTCYTGYNVPGQGKGDMDALKLHLVCLDRQTGKQLWISDVTPKLPEQPTIRDDHGYASCTVATDGKNAFVFFGKSGVFAFDMNGKQIWQANVGTGLNGWGTAASPVLHGDLVIVNASVESQSMYALDKKTGTEVWRARGIREAWNTPLLVTLKDGKTELIVAMPGKVLGFEPTSGEQLWSCANDITWYIVPSIVAHEDTLWSIGGRSGVAAVALRAGGRGDVTKTHRMWTSQKGSNVSSPIIHEGHLYWMHDNQSIAYCAEAETGNMVYQERIDRAGQVYASAVMADGKLYYTNRSGKTFVVAANPKYELLATNDLRDNAAFNASAAISGSRLLIRSDSFLYCLGTK